MATASKEVKKYRLLVNDARQFSIWSATKSIPAGWHDTSKSGNKAECLSFLLDSWNMVQPKTIQDVLTRIGKKH